MKEFILTADLNWEHVGYFEHLELRKAKETGGLGLFASIDFKKPHQPLLFIGGENDNIFSAQFTQKIAGSYQDKNSVTDFKAFAGRSHFLCGEKGWEEIADYILGWLEN